MSLAGALSFHQAGDLAAAERAYRAVLAAAPEQGDAWNNLGLLLNAQGRLQEAQAALKQACAHQPDNPRAFANLGVVLRQLGFLEEARLAQTQALSLRPDFAPAHNNLGNLLHSDGQFAAARQHFEQACRLDGRVFEHHFMLGKCLLELRDFEGAWAALRRALSIDPANADCHGTLARVWLDQLRLPEALTCYDEGVSQRPDYDPLRYNRGLARLLNGDLPGGFADYECRWQVPDFPSKRLATDKPQWDGRAIPSGALLLHAEQGLGDTLQMLRYLPQVAARVGRVWLLIQAPLRGLVQLPDNVQWLEDGQKFPPVDAVCPLLSLPHLFGTDILSIPAPIPYLHVDEARQASWRKRLAASAPAGTRKIGLTWAGNPAHRNDANRSLPFEHLRPLLRLPGLQWYALQVGNGREALAEHPEIIDLGPELKDFTDTAAALEQLDLLVTVDTSIAHVAGALGLPVWLMLPFVPDWRWLLDRDDSPWYPSLTIFRQPGHGLWAALIDQVSTRLQTLMQDQTVAAEQATEAGRGLLEQGQGEAAERQFWRALRLRPWHGRAMSGLAVLAWKLNRPAAALIYGERACRLDPDNPEAWSNYGAYLKGNALHAQALAQFDAAVARFPQNAGLRYNRGLARLLCGDLPGGFADYESRWQVPDFPSKRLVTDKPDWDGKAMPQGTVLLHAEQGLGDTLQMLRYLPQVAARVGQVWLMIQAPLRGLVQLPANVRMLEDGQTLPAFDVVCPLLSLPHVLQTTLESIPAGMPYLKVDPLRQAQWQARIAREAVSGQLKIGLTWAGNPSHRNDANRSLPFAQLATLLNLPGIQWFALQVGGGREVLAQHPEVIDLGPELKDFTDTAAALEQLDLLISVDTSIAHVAGGLGMPVWLLLPQVPDWRWLLDRDDSPWYPSLSIFRQQGHQQWPALISDICARLQALQQDQAIEVAAEHATEAGRVELEQRQPAAAERQFWQAIRQRPWHGRAMSGLAVLAWKQHRPAAALTFGARACRLDPGNPEAWSNYGAYLKAEHRYEEALVCQQQALKLAPDNPTALSNLGNLLGKLERWAEARKPAERALALAPQVADFHYNAGIIFKELGEFALALKHLRQAQSLNGEHVKARLHEAMVCLLQGDFAAGWPAYESRWQQPDCKEKHSFACPLWQGQDLADKTILLYSEQGLGDSFQFMRYAPLVAERAGRTLLVVQPEVEALARRMPGRHEVFASGAALPDFDFHCPLLSLPLAFGTRVDTVPAQVPYLRADAARQAHWQAALAQRLPAGKKRVGLVWAGRPTHGNDHNRSLRLANFSALLADERFAWVALQKGPAVAEAMALSPGVSLTVLNDELHDFDDTAAVLTQLDLLVTVDTSVAHLAGALGVPSLILLPQLPDWRWMWQRSDSPWYPGVTLLRQKKRGDWSGVLQQLHELLPARAGSSVTAPANGRRKTASKKKGK